MAWNIYGDAVTMSGFDANGLPMLSMLPHILRWQGLDTGPDHVYNLIARIKIIHSRVLNIRIAKLPHA